MMHATQFAVLAARLRDVIDFEAIGLAQPAIPRIAAADGLVPAARAPVAIAALRRAPRKRPPVVLPERVGTAVAAPRAAPLRQRLAAPTARPRLPGRKAAYRK